MQMRNCLPQPGRPKRRGGFRRASLWSLLLKKPPECGMVILSQIKLPRVSEVRNPFRISRRICPVSLKPGLFHLYFPGKASRLRRCPERLPAPSAFNLPSILYHIINLIQHLRYILIFQVLLCHPGITCIHNRFVPHFQSCPCGCYDGRIAHTKWILDDQAVNLPF